MAIKKIEYANKKVRYEVYARVGGRNSKRIRKRFDKKSDAERYLSQLRLEGEEARSNKIGGGLKETSYQLEAEYWLTHTEAKMSPGYKLRVKGILKRQLKNFGNLILDKLDLSFVSKYQLMLKSTGSSHASINRETEVINAVLNFSVLHRRIPLNPIKGVKKLKAQNEGVSFWDVSEAQSFLTFASRKYPSGSKYRWVYVVYLLALNTGLRAGEIWGLQRQDLVDEGQLLYVRRQYNRITHDYAQTKGKDARHVPVNDELRKEISALLLTHKEVRADAPVFWGRRGRGKNHDTFRKQKFDVDVRAWGGRIIRFHDLRHTAATLMIDANLDLKTVKEICGHKDIATTMNYVHLLGRKVKEAAKSFSITPHSHTQTLKLVKHNKS